MPIRTLGLRFARVLVLSALTCLVGGVARAGTVFSTLSGTYASNLPVGATGADWTYGAQQFNSGANTSISSVALNLTNVGGNTGTFDVEIWTSATGSPGAFVGSIATNQSQGSITGAFQNYLYSGAVSVSQNTDYWVVFNASNMSGQVLWAYTNDDPSQNPGFVGVNGTSLLQSTDSPLSWATPSGITAGRLKMEVVAVPEPPALVLSGVGFASAVYFLRRRRG